MASTTTNATSDVVEGSPGVLRRNTGAAVTKARDLVQSSDIANIAKQISGSTSKYYSEFKTSYPAAASKLDVAEKRIVDVVDKAVGEGASILDKVDGVIDANVKYVGGQYEVVVKPRVQSVQEGVETTLKSEEVLEVRTTGSKFVASVISLFLALSIRGVTAAQSTLDPESVLEETKSEPSLNSLLSSLKSLSGVVQARTTDKLVSRSGVQDQTISELSSTACSPDINVGSRCFAWAKYALIVCRGAVCVLADDVAPRYSGPACNAVNKLAGLARDTVKGDAVKGDAGIQENIHPGETVGVLPRTPAGSSSSLEAMATTGR